MKFQANSPDASMIQAYGPDWLQVGQRRLEASVLLGSDGAMADWACDRFDALNADLFAQTLSLMDGPPEVVVFGSGTRLRFPRPQWLRALVDARVGVETMDLGAACRTYNILAGEGRRVVLAALLEPVPPST
ncbi:hypothetical protein CCO03_09135 [Comamonas serinivorans]|uniref:Xcc1710-like domain-containing protein n=1 Tax=Comamonas serinivorans TaxID=1082851 RepID=A0A1Y0EN00_9BURK|nr:Mth938-like domain-containing protein [Comamonas serinivorans]ARU04820.1 hypothetical protein CCO03_09135 [Comamonas serinivorans]